MTGWMTYKGLELPDSAVGDAGNKLTDDLKLLADGVGSALPMAADSYVIAARGESDLESGANLRAAYAAAKLLTPGGNALAATNRATVLIPPGRYDFGAGAPVTNDGLLLDTQYVDLIGISNNATDTILTSTISTANRGTVQQTASDVHIANLTIDINASTNAYYPNSDLPATKLINILFMRSSGTASVMRIAITYSGRYYRCMGTVYPIFTGASTLSGTFIDCMGGGGSFGFSYGNTVSGIFINCEGGNGSFGGGGTVSGTFINCTGGSDSFGGMGPGYVPGTVTTDAVFKNCQMIGDSWGSESGWRSVFAGRMYDCYWKVTGTNKTALSVGAGARIYNSTLIATGTGKSIDADSAVNAVIAQCRLNKGIGTNVTNLVATPYNVDDANIS